MDSNDEREEKKRAPHISTSQRGIDEGHGMENVTIAKLCPELNNRGIIEKATVEIVRFGR